MLLKALGVKRKTDDRRRGDRCRDERNWPGAVAAYLKHLDAYPDDQAIWVQLGHGWKEQGILGEAANAYGTAVELNPGDADAALHFANILMRLGRAEEALGAYESANAIRPNLEAIEQMQLLRRDGTDETTLGLGKGTVFFAIQDFFEYLKAHVTMSGIQRVQAGIAVHAIKDPDIDVRFVLGNIGSATPMLPVGEFWMIDNAALMRIIDYASSEQVDHDILRAMLRSCEAAGQRVRPLAGSTIILLGAFWGLGNGVRHFMASKRDGVRIGAYVYDIIPVTHPEFCDDALVIDFGMAICELCRIADFIFTISDATRIALADFIAENGGREVPMVTVPLAHHLTRTTGTHTAWPAQLSRVRGRRYVAYVSTIEGRKNHLYVVNAWRRLLAENVDVPDLVFVGRHGWKIGALEDVLGATENLNGRLHIAHNLSDGELNAVYANCAFSVFTSFVEGWGLPIGESLFHGRPCVASDTSSIPEVGGDLVDYVDPFNLTDGIAVFRRMATDAAYLREREVAIRDRFVARTWHDVGADFMAQTKRYQTAPVAPYRPVLGEGVGHLFKREPTERVDIGRYFHQPTRLLIESASLYPTENHGVWLHGANPEIVVATDMQPGTQVLVYLGLSVAPWAAACRVEISDGLGKSGMSVIDLATLTDRKPIRWTTCIDDEGVIRIRFDVIGTYTKPKNETRDFTIGLVSIGFARTSNITARQELIEAMTIHIV